MSATDSKKAERQREQLIRAYKDLVEKFPESKYTSQAKERLSALGAK